jgi:hypothetical protein
MDGAVDRAAKHSASWLSGAALTAAVALLSVAPIRNYDLFWHLATGRWIAEHRSIPSSDPFAVASGRGEWINGEWLFELIAFGLHELGGIGLLSVSRGLLAAAIFAASWAIARRDTSTAWPMVLAALAWAGAAPIFDFRPSSAAMLLLVVTLGLRSPLAHGLASVLWINIHPSALIAPGIAFLVTRRPAVAIASAAGLLVNPWGWRAIAAPLELLAFVSEGSFVNAEWLPSPPRLFPLLYVLIAGGAASFAHARRRENWWRVVLFAALAFLAIRHARHQPLFFGAFPVLVATSVMVPLRKVAAWSIVAASILLTAVSIPHAAGISPSRFPVVATARLAATGLNGNIYNPDQFGGFLIWAFYPERRVLTDGRNELHRSYIPEFAAARGDERKWRELLRKYRVDIAVDEYRQPLQVTEAGTGRTRALPASLAYWPRSEWALIAYDEAAMVFARREAYRPEVVRKWEIRAVPDAP